MFRKGLPERTPGEDYVGLITPDKPFTTYQEAPELAEMVEAGTLPPVRERLPDLPPIVPPYDSAGKYGGAFRFIEGHYTNFGSLTRFSNEPLCDLSITRGLVTYPNLAESYDISDDLMTYTLRLRKGIKWSHTGEEVTTKDVCSPGRIIASTHPIPK